MDDRLKVEYVGIDTIKPYKRNAKLHPEEQVEQIKRSMLEMGDGDALKGFLDPIGVWNGEIVEGHGRYLAAKELGIDTVPIIRLDELTDEQRRAYGLIHNQLTMNSGFDIAMRDLELGDLELDMSAFGFEMDESVERHEWFDREEKDGADREEGNEEYNEFLDKFEPKKTTDDCYTPEVVYNAVADWVASEYGVKKKDFVRPFYPGGNYQKERYKPGAVVVDNPPFSILAEIVNFYAERGIKFFLFAPTLTLFSSSSSSSSACSLCIGVTVTYENGANVDTSFLTNLEPETRLRSAPTLYNAVKEANDANLKEMRRELPKYTYPDYVITSTRCGQFSRYGIDFRVGVNESQHIRALDAQKEKDKAVFGSAYLLSEAKKQEKEKAEREKAEREKAERWDLSEREMEIVRQLGR